MAASIAEDCPAEPGLKDTTPPKTPALAPANDIEKALQRINGLKNVRGTIIMSKDGSVLRSTLPEDEVASLYATHVSGLTTMARSSIRELDNRNDLLMLRLRSATQEIIVINESHFNLIVVQSLKDIGNTKQDDPPSLENQSVE